jgi:hypothetical protein
MHIYKFIYTDIQTFKMVTEIPVCPLCKGSGVFATELRTPLEVRDAINHNMFMLKCIKEGKGQLEDSKLNRQFFEQRIEILEWFIKLREL